MAEQNFWNNLGTQVGNGVSTFVQNEIDRINGPAKTEPQPDASKSVLERLQAQMTSNTTLILIVAAFIIAAVFMTSGGRRGK